MLFKNNLTPAVAHAGYQGAKSKSSAEREGISLMNAKEDDFGSYSSNPSGGAKKKTAQNGAPKKNAPQKNERTAHKSNKRFMPFVYAIIAIVAVVIVIAIVVAIINAPGSNMKKSDAVYITYQDADGNWRIAVDGEELEYKFVNEITLEVADNNTFAYVSEKLASGNSKIYILEDEELIPSGRTEVKEILKKSLLTPCVIYKAADMNGIYCFKGEGDDNTVTGDENASNFVIVPDGSAVYFTIPAVAVDGTATIELKQYKKSQNKTIATGFIPIHSSADGEYVYVTTLERKGFAYFNISDDKADFKQIQGISNYIYDDGITATNVDGDQVILATKASDGTISSYFYEIGDDSATAIGTGIFTSVHYDPEVLFEDSLLDSYFEVEDSFVTDNTDPDEDDDDEDEEADNNVITNTTGKKTCFLNSKMECVSVAPTTGKFSPDGKYFYYIDATTKSLKRVSLSSKKFDKHEDMPPNGEIADFYITQKSDLYVLVKENNKDNVLSLYFVDASTSPSPELLSVKVDTASIFIAVNTIYFTETTTDANGITATAVYSSTNGSRPETADFEDYTPNQAPRITMGAGKQGYAVFETGEASKIFYTSNGKSFDFLCDALPSVVAQ